MDNENMPELDDVPEEVRQTLRAASRYLMGRGPAPDIDALPAPLRDLVDELLPAIIDLVGDRIVPADDNEDTHAVIGGRRLRSLRENADITPQELATRVSARGKTITAATIDSYEAALEISVDADLARALADSLGIEVDDLADKPNAIDRVVFADIHGTRPSVSIEVDDRPTARDLETLLRAVVSDFGLAVRLAVLDVEDENELRSHDALETAAQLLDIDDAVPNVLLIAGRDRELGTQIIDLADLRDGYVVPDGERLSAPRRRPLALRDAIQYLFEEVGGDWSTPPDDTTLDAGSDMTEMAASCAHQGIDDATKSTVHVQAKIDARADIDGDEAAALAQLLVRVQRGQVTSGEPFHDAFESELVGAGAP